MVGEKVGGGQAVPWRMKWDLPKGKVSTETHLCKGVEVRTGFHEFTDSCCWELRVLGGGDDQTVAEEAGRPRVKGWGSVCPLGNRKPIELYLPGNSMMRLVLLSFFFF